MGKAEKERKKGRKGICQEDNGGHVPNLKRGRASLLTLFCCWKYDWKKKLTRDAKREI